MKKHTYEELKRIAKLKFCDCALTETDYQMKHCSGWKSPLTCCEERSDWEEISEGCFKKINSLKTDN